MRLLTGVRLARLCSGKPLFICLDFDGTLAPIRRIPAAARISEKKRELLRRLVAVPGYKLAIVSGRGLEDISAKLNIPGVMLAADHGFVIRRGKDIFHPFALSQARPLIRAFCAALRRRLRGVRGVMVEAKGMTLTVHYRCVAGSRVAGFREAVFRLKDAFAFRKSLCVRQGKMCLEVRPALPWDKGSAVMWLLLRLVKESGKAYLPLYIGDDATDEDAFRVVKSVGITVRVGRDSASSAEYYVNDTSEVGALLRGIWLLNT